MNKHTMAAALLAAGLTLGACGGATLPAATTQATTAATTQAATTTATQTQGIDYKALVNKLNPLPEGWEDALQTVKIKNSLGDDVEVEKKAYDAYLALKADLEKEGVHVDLDSARRSVAEQQRIMDEFTEKYGADYAKKTVATPGYSEHHTGLALDLYLNIDGKDVYLNEDMVQYPEVWAQIHAKLAEHGFILRYLKGAEHITGYGYEPWHIRYLDDVDLAKEITQRGITFEEYLAGKDAPTVSYNLEGSQIFSAEDLEEAAVQVKCQFATFAGCELHSLSFAGDASNSPENLAKVKAHDSSKEYTQVMELTTNFHTPAQGSDAFEADKEIEGYQWWLAREDGKGWQLITWGN